MPYNVLYSFLMGAYTYSTQTIKLRLYRFYLYYLPISKYIIIMNALRVNVSIYFLTTGRWFQVNQCKKPIVRKKV